MSEIGTFRTELELAEDRLAITDNGVARLREGGVKEFVSLDQISRLQIGSYDRPSMTTVRSAVVFSLFGYIVSWAVHITSPESASILQRWAPIFLVMGSTIVLLIGLSEYRKIRRGEVETVVQVKIKLHGSGEWFHSERDEDLDISKFEMFMSELSEVSSVELERHRGSGLWPHQPPAESIA